MDMNIYVGNLSYGMTEEDLKNIFSEHGAVSSVNIIKDRVTGNSKGFGFVEMENDDEGQKAIDELNGTELQGRPLKVNLARPRTERPRQERRSW
jgi:RNA recognition motif-containing protein